jgi:hypothetical protein
MRAKKKRKERNDQIGTLYNIYIKQKEKRKSSIYNIKMILILTHTHTKYLYKHCAHYKIRIFIHYCFHLILFWFRLVSIYY